jgi:hypothetical protein
MVGRFVVAGLCTRVVCENEVVVVGTNEEETGLSGAWEFTEEGMGMGMVDKVATRGVIEEVYMGEFMFACSGPPIVPFHTTWQDSVLNDDGAWLQKWSSESRTKKPGKVALPVVVSRERRFEAFSFTENARDKKTTWNIQLKMEKTR